MNHKRLSSGSDIVYQSIPVSQVEAAAALCTAAQIKRSPELCSLSQLGQLSLPVTNQFKCFGLTVDLLVSKRVDVFKAMTTAACITVPRSPALHSWALPMRMLKGRVGAEMSLRDLHTLLPMKDVAVQGNVPNCCPKYGMVLNEKKMKFLMIRRELRQRTLSRSQPAALHFAMVATVCIQKGTSKMSKNISTVSRLRKPSNEFQLNKLVILRVADNIISYNRIARNT